MLSRRHVYWYARSAPLFVASILVLAVALAGCDAAGQASGPPQPTPSPTATYRLGGKFATATAEAWTPTLPPDAALHAPVPGNQLNWASANLPPDFGMSYHQSWLGVSANNGNIAYSCSQNGAPPGTSAPPVETVRTSNAGAAWSRVANVYQSWDGCGFLVVDDNNPSIVAMDGMGMPDVSDEFATTRDGGQSWRVGPIPAVGYVGALASVGARTYGMFAQGQTETLDVSTDGLATWRDITGPMAHQGLTAFWANPVTGALLAETAPSYLSPVTLWSSSDGGAHWSSHALPYAAPSSLVVKAATDASPWAICLNDSSASIACSDDSGMTWNDLPSLEDNGLRGYASLGIASDGAVLALGSTDSDWPIYRLARGATRWQSLGSVPRTTGSVIYARVAGSDGVLWAFPSVKGGGSGDSNPSDVYSARYPY
jgi:hypothetical protein